MITKTVKESNAAIEELRQAIKAERILLNLYDSPFPDRVELQKRAEIQGRIYELYANLSLLEGLNKIP